MIASETIAEMNSVLDHVFRGMRPKKEWRKIRRELKRLNRAIERGDDQGVRSALEPLGKHGYGIMLAQGGPSLGHGGGIGQSAVAPPPETVALKNRIIGSL